MHRYVACGNARRSGVGEGEGQKRNESVHESEDRHSPPFFSPPIAVCADEQGDDECGQRDCAPDNEHGIRARVRPGDSEPKERDRHRPYDEICGDEHEFSESAAALDGACALFEIVEIVKIV